MPAEPLQKILYVEDDDDIRQIANLALEMVGGLTVRACASGAEAVAQAAAFKPQLILLDVMMPGLDGPATMTALRSLPGTANTPVIFMTAKVQPQEVARIRALGAIDVVAKPFDPMTLAETIRGIWDRTP